MDLWKGVSQYHGFLESQYHLAEMFIMKNNIYGILIFLCCLQGCGCPNNDCVNNKYVQYYVSTIRIKNPRVVIFNEQGGSRIPTWNLVCPDSAVKYCTEPNWIDRDDVFLFNTSIYQKEQGSFPAQGNWFYKLKPWDRGYPIWYETAPYNDTIYLGRFFFDDDLTFTLSLHTTSIMYDNTTRISKNAPWNDEYDLLDTVMFANTYRLAVHPRYSLWQFYKLKKIHDTQVYYDMEEYPDTMDNYYYKSKSINK